jgi:hypothetical protein
LLSLFKQRRKKNFPLDAFSSFSINHPSLPRATRVEKSTKKHRAAPSQHRSLNMTQPRPQILRAERWTRLSDIISDNLSDLEDLTDPLKSEFHRLAFIVPNIGQRRRQEVASFMSKMEECLNCMYDFLPQGGKFADVLNMIPELNDIMMSLVQALDEYRGQMGDRYVKVTNTEAIMDILDELQYIYDQEYHYWLQ